MRWKACIELGRYENIILYIVHVLTSCFLGGYELEPLAKSVAASVAQLLPAPLVPEDQLEYEESLNTIKPNRGAVDSLKRVANVQRHYWDLPEEFTSPEFRFMLPEEWRARDNFATRPRRSVKPVKPPRNIEGY